MIRIPTGRKQTSWLTGYLQGWQESWTRDYPEQHQFSSGQGKIWTQGDRIEIQRPKALGHPASLKIARCLV